MQPRRGPWNAVKASSHYLLLHLIRNRDAGSPLLGVARLSRVWPFCLLRAIVALAGKLAQLLA